MDLLADILSQAGLRRRILNQRSLPEGLALEFPCDKSFGFHVVTQGEAYVFPPGQTEPIVLRKGDVALMARGCAHVVTTAPKFNRADVKQLGYLEDSRKERAPGVKTVLVSGAYQFWNTPVHPFFSELPDWFVMRGEAVGTLEPLALAIGLLGEEVGEPDLGSENVVNALLDVLFVYLLRKIVEKQGEVPKSWGHSLRDEQVRKAVELMHADCAHEWTLTELASKVGVSRAGLAQKFRQAMGETPLNYLRTVRMQRAMRLLTESRDNLESVAAAVGYKDAFGFSKVFKKTVGLSPRDFRARDVDERAAPFRFR